MHAGTVFALFVYCLQVRARSLIRLLECTGCTIAVNDRNPQEGCLPLSMSVGAGMFCALREPVG
jgi:hypothetical protein